MKKRIVSLTVILSMALAMIPAFSLTASAEEFTGSDGTGTADNPYIIETLADLEELSTYAAENDTSGKYFKLTADIDMSGKYGADKGEEGGTSWTPIGKIGIDENDCSFKGEFDGDGHAISGLYISYSENMSWGLFGQVGAGGARWPPGG